MRDNSEILELENVIVSDFHDFPFILIPTSAGSGKTELLAKRFVYLLLRECYSKDDLRKFLAITFTREAAKEMKRRVLQILDDLRRGNFGRFPSLMNVFREEEIKDRINKVYQIVLENYPRLQIGTIDSFMERIRRLLLHELGLRFTLKLQYEVDIEVLNLAVESLLRSPERFNEILDIVIELAEGSDEFKWDLLKTFNEEMMKLKNVEDRVLYDIKPHPLFTTVKCDGSSEIGEEVAKLQNLMPKARRKFTKDESYEALMDYLSSRENAYNFAKELNERKDLAEEVHWGLLCVLERYNKLKTKVAKIYDGFYKPEYKKILNTMGVMTISDTSRIVRDYLLSPENYSYKLIKFLWNLRHILIDEFQDTDPQQWEILLYLIRDQVLSTGGTLFIVGDIKQAIYGFRKADYKIMYNLLTVDGYKSYSLNTPPLVPRVTDKNFRSAEAIVKFVNEVVFNSEKFGIFLSERIQSILHGVVSEERAKSETQNIAEKYKSIWVPIKQVAEKSEKGYVRNIKIPNSKDEKVKDKKPSIGKVESGLSQENKKKRKDEKLSAALPVLKELILELLKEYKPGDITVMARDNDMVLHIAGFIEKELAQPVVCFSSLDVRSHKILWELISLIKFLYDPKSLNSALVFCTGLIVQKLTNKDTEKLLQEFFDFVVRGFEAENEISRLLRRLRDSYSGYIGKRSLARLISDIIHEFGLLKEDGFRGAILRFLNYLFTAEARDGYLTVDRVEEVFSQFIKNNGISQIEDLSIPQKTEINAIKVMTFHKSKGLGFPIVINVFIDSKGNHDILYFDKIHDQRLLYPFKIKKDYLKVIDSGLIRNIYTERMLERYIEDKIDELVQEINTIYVALTRAKKRMYNIYIEGDLFHSLMMAVGADEKEYGEPVPVGVEVHEESPTLLSLGFLDKKSSFEIFIEKAYEEVHSGDDLLGVKASLLGDAVHEFLRSIDFIDTPEELLNLKERMRAIAHKYCVELSLVEEILKTLVDYFSKGDRIKILSRKQGIELYREREIGLPDGSFERVDRLIVGSDFVEVIDFKTGEPKSQDFEQIREYIRVLREIFPAKKVKGYLVYVFKDKIEEVIYDQ